MKGQFTQWQIVSVKIIVSFAVLSLLIAYSSFLHIASSIDWDTDYKYLYFSAQQVLKHANIYHPLRFFSPSLNGITEAVNLNPPLVAILMAPLGWMSYTASFWIWNLLNLVLETGSIFLIIHKFFRPQQEKFLIYLVGVLLLLAYFPTFSNLYAQTGGFLFFLTTLGWLSFREKKPGSAGFFWGLAFSTKLFMGLFLWMLIWRKEWRCLKIFLLTTLVCAVIPILISGPDVYLNYYAIFAKVHWYSASWNASLLGFFSRLFGYFNESNHPLINFPQMTLLFYSIGVVVLLSAFVFFEEIRPQCRPRESGDPFGKSTRCIKKVFVQASVPAEVNNEKEITNDLAVAYTLVTMLLISPLAWIYYFSLLLIPCAIIFYWNQRLFHQPLFNLFLAAALFFSSIPHLLLKPHEIISGADIFLWGGCYFYALCILGIIIFTMKRLFNQGISRRSEIKSSVLAMLFTAAFLPSFFGIVMMVYLLVTIQV